MKLQSLVYATLFAAMSSLSFAAHADNSTDMQPTATESQPATPAAKKMKHHSHMEEKTGVAPATASDTTSGETTDKPKKKSRHSHPVDGK